MSVRTATFTAVDQTTPDGFLVPTGHSFEVQVDETDPAWEAVLSIDDSITGYDDWHDTTSEINKPGTYPLLQHGAVNGGNGGMYYRVRVKDYTSGTITVRIINNL